MPARVKCENCGKEPARLYGRTDPRNYSQERLLLCAPCGRREGLSPLDFGRGAGGQRTAFRETGGWRMRPNR